MLVLAPAAGSWAAQPEVGELVDKAVKALKTTSYEARMHFYAQYDAGQEQTVHIYHVAPDLYHVEPLVKGQHGEWTYQGYYLLENAQELLRIVTDGKGNAVVIQELPERSFYLNDALTGKFLKDLARHEGTVVLDGAVGPEGAAEFIDVYQLRQLAYPEKPYTITIGLDKRNYFPVFLLVQDSDGVAKVYLKMEAIEYKKATEIPVKLFQTPKGSGQAAKRAPLVEQNAPAATIVVPQEEADRDEARLMVQRAPSAAAAEVKPLDYALPPYPARVPEGYYLESLNLLDYTGHGEPALVYQFELFNPAAGDTLSIFVTQSDNFMVSSGDQGYNQPGLGYVLVQENEWLVAVFGDLSIDRLMDVADGLAPDYDRVEELLERTQLLDQMLDQLAVDD
ncbi:hypothetical protein JW859_06620 [bacterium]|nr:hypothetical protein [bacterium]